MITDCEIFQNYCTALVELKQTLDKRIDVRDLTNEKAVNLTSDIDDFLVSLRKYWM